MLDRKFLYFSNFRWLINSEVEAFQDLQEVLLIGSLGILRPEIWLQIPNPNGVRPGRCRNAPQSPSISACQKASSLVPSSTISDNAILGLSHGSQAWCCLQLLAVFGQHVSLHLILKANKLILKERHEVEHLWSLSFTFYLDFWPLRHASILDASVSKLFESRLIIANDWWVHSLCVKEQRRQCGMQFVVRIFLNLDTMLRSSGALGLLKRSWLLCAMVGLFFSFWIRWIQRLDETLGFLVSTQRFLNTESHVEFVW